jgi:hypothetical protein
MDVRDGFIVGIYNYCDSWCDRCAFTSRCRVFADMRKIEATLDPNLEPVVAAPEHPSDTAPPPPAWLRELLAEMDEAARNPPPMDVDVRRELRAVPGREDLDRRAEAYSRRARAWLHGRDSDRWYEADDPRAVIAWFHMMIHVKAMRALHGLAEDDPDERDWPPDYDGSAKVALLGIDQSHTAWLDLVEVGLVPLMEATPFIDDLVWLRDALERTFPKARSFVRPGFDEPEEVARLLRSESEA